MANFDDTDGFGPQHEPAEPARFSVAQVISIAGALMSLALVIGIGVWGYRLVMRDVSGVPVVRALEGPMRIQPEDPGGEAVDYQGLAVNRVAAEGTAAPPPERLILAPRPVELASEDVPVEPGLAAADGAGPFSDGGDAAAGVGLAGAPSSPALGAPKGGGAAGKVTPVAMRVATPDAVPGQAAAAAVASASPPEAAPPPRNQVAPAVVPMVQDAPGVRVSLRPPARPRPAPVSTGSADAARAAAIAAALKEATSVEIAAAELTPGTALAQLGAFETADLARDAWKRISTRFGDYMKGRQRVVQKASSGGRVFYRLRVAGFSDLREARRFCAALEAENADCIPVVLR